MGRGQLDGNWEWKAGIVVKACLTFGGFYLSVWGVMG
jgi:hypothetical protein